MDDEKRLTYGEHMQLARHATGRQEVGETLPPLLDRFKQIIEDAVQKNYDKGVRGKYYIHIWVRKEPYANNTLHIFPQTRRTRPSPYQADDHFLWTVEDGGKVTFEWCIPSREIVGYILENPNKFDAEYVSMIRMYVKDTLECPEDYIINDRDIPKSYREKTPKIVSIYS